MQVQAQIIDGNTGQPLAGATISIDGTAMAQSDANGNFSINTSGTNAVISYVGYDPANLTVEALSGTGQLYLYPTAAALPEVTVVAQAIKKNPIPFAAALGVGILLLNKKKKVSGIDTSTLLLVGGGLLAAYFLMKPAAVAPVQSAPIYNPVASGASGNSTAAIISASGSTASALINAFSNIDF
jgi:carboxypeptidase-like protein